MKLDPFAQMTKAFETWNKLATDSFARTAAFYGQVGKLEAKGVERAETAIQEIAKLTKESVSYGAELSAAWRKLSLEAMQGIAQTMPGAAEAMSAASGSVAEAGAKA